MRTLVFIFSLLLTGLVAQAQTSGNGTGLSLGLRAGGNVLLNKEEDIDFQGLAVKSNYAPGFTGGLVLNYGFSSAFSIQPEILYTRISTQYEASYRGEDIEVHYNLNAIEVPLLLKYSFGNKIRPFVNAGPFIYYGLNIQEKFTVGDQTETETIKYDQNEGRLEYGVAGGLGVAIPMGPGSLLVEGRFNYGLGANAITSTDYEGLRSQVATLSVSYLIRLGRK